MTLTLRRCFFYAETHECGHRKEVTGNAEGEKPGQHKSGGAVP